MRTSVQDRRENSLGTESSAFSLDPSVGLSNESAEPGLVRNIVYSADWNRKQKLYRSENGHFAEE